MLGVRSGSASDQLLPVPQVGEDVRAADFRGSIDFSTSSRCSETRISTFGDFTASLLLRTITFTGRNHSLGNAHNTLMMIRAGTMRAASLMAYISHRG